MNHVCDKLCSKATCYPISPHQTQLSQYLLFQSHVIAPLESQIQLHFKDLYETRFLILLDEWHVVHSAHSLAGLYASMHKTFYKWVNDMCHAPLKLL